MIQLYGYDVYDIQVYKRSTNISEKYFLPGTTDKRKQIDKYVQRKFV